LPERAPVTARDDCGHAKALRLRSHGIVFASESCMDTEVADMDALRELVAEHAMSWKVTHEEAVVDGELQPIGFKVELSAVHSHPRHEPSPGCAECRPVIVALERVIGAALPHDARRSRYDVFVPPAKLAYDPGLPAEITATITILHNEGINDPIDECERRCLADITSRLRALGAREGSSSVGGARTTS